jgi:hypothetical protein
MSAGFPVCFVRGLNLFSKESAGAEQQLDQLPLVLRDTKGRPFFLRLKPLEENKNMTVDFIFFLFVSLCARRTLLTLSREGDETRAHSTSFE